MKHSLAAFLVLSLSAHASLAAETLKLSGMNENGDPLKPLSRCRVELTVDGAKITRVAIKGLVTRKSVWLFDQLEDARDVVAPYSDEDGGYRFGYRVSGRPTFEARASASGKFTTIAAAADLKLREESAPVDQRIELRDTIVVYGEPTRPTKVAFRGHEHVFVMDIAPLRISKRTLGDTSRRGTCENLKLDTVETAPAPRALERLPGQSPEPAN